MDRPARAAADFRLVRAAVFAVVCVLLSALGHGVASGMPVGTGVLLIGWLAVMCVVVPLAGRRRSLRGITAGLAVGQFGLHMMFCLAQCSSGMSGASGSPVGQDHGVTALVARLVCGGLPAGLTSADAARLVRQAGFTPGQAAAASFGAAPMPGMGSPGSSGLRINLMLTPGMVTAHLLAALLLGLLLWRGEAALWHLAQRSRRTLDATVAAASVALRDGCAALALLAAGAGLEDGERLAARAACRRPEPRRPRTLPVRHGLVRRGPPPAAAAA